MKLRIRTLEIEALAMLPGIIETERYGKTLKELMVTFRVEGPAAKSSPGNLTVPCQPTWRPGRRYKLGLMTDGSTGDDKWFTNVWLLRERERQ